MATTRRPADVRSAQEEPDAGPVSRDSAAATEAWIAEIRRIQAELEEQVRASEEPTNESAKRRRKR